MGVTHRVPGAELSARNMGMNGIQSFPWRMCSHEAQTLYFSIQGGERESLGHRTTHYTPYSVYTLYTLYTHSFIHQIHVKMNHVPGTYLGVGNSEVMKTLSPVLLNLVENEKIISYREQFILHEGASTLSCWWWESSLGDVKHSTGDGLCFLPTLEVQWAGWRLNTERLLAWVGEGKC